MAGQNHHLSHAADKWFGKTAEDLTDRERQVLDRTAQRKTVSQNINTKFDDGMTFGDRLAGRVAAFGGSWKFIILFGVVLMVWVASNLALARIAFDPYPFIFLNLILSMLAALQAPIIMMSQNRQAVKDRLDAAHDYEVNLKAEIEIMALHDKLDQLRTQEIEAVLRKQEEQIALLTRMLAQSSVPAPDRP